MKSLERRHKNIVAKNPNFSSLSCFTRAVDGQGFSKQTVHRWFYKLVEKDDYQRADVKGILAELDSLSKSAEDDKKQGYINTQSFAIQQRRLIARPQLQTAQI